MYAAENEGQHLTFGVSGKLIMNALVMYDHQTDTLWSHFTGDAVEGPLKGDKLQILSALHTTWGQWLALHPDTVALDKFGYGSRDGYTSYYDSDQTGIIKETNTDDRLPPKTLVAAVSIGDQHKAYSVGDLREHPVVNDTFADVPLLVVYHAGSATSAIFEREVDGELLEFTALPVDWEDAPLVMDQEGTTWHGLSGMALDGPRAGDQLRRMQTHYSFWFAWKDWRPGTEVVGAGGINSLLRSPKCIPTDDHILRIPTGVDSFRCILKSFCRCSQSS